jgi:hypothetical protein
MKPRASSYEQDMQKLLTQSARRERKGRKDLFTAEVAGESQRTPRTGSNFD